MIHSNFSRRIIKFASENPEYNYLQHTTSLGNTHATPYYALKSVAYRLRTTQRPEWNALRVTLPKPSHKGTCYAKCSFGRFATFGATASAHVHYGHHAWPLLTCEQIKQLQDPVISFVIQLLAKFSSTVERPFLKATHDLDRTQVSVYQSFRDGYVGGVRRMKEDLDKQDPSPLNAIQATLTGMLLDAALETLDKHNILPTASSDVTIETTNRAGETYFRYSREELGDNRRMRAILMWGYMMCKLSRYGSDAQQRLTPGHMREAQDLLNDPTRQYKYLGILRLEKTLRDKLIQDAKEQVLAEERELVEWMHMRGLIKEPHNALTVEVMKEALRWLKTYWPALGLAVGGNREVLKDRLVYLRSEWENKADATIPPDADLLDPFGEDGDFSDME